MFAISPGNELSLDTDGITGVGDPLTQKYIAHT